MRKGVGDGGIAWGGLRDLGDLGDMWSWWIGCVLHLDVAPATCGCKNALPAGVVANGRRRCAAGLPPGGWSSGEGKWGAGAAA